MTSAADMTPPQPAPKTQVRSAPRAQGLLRARRRALLWLGGTALFFVLLAGLSLFLRQRSADRDFAPALAFPDLSSRVNDVTVIAVETKDKAFTVTRRSDGSWVVPGKNNFSADLPVVQAALLGLSEMNLIEQRTARADWHKQLELNLPKEGGPGVLVSFSDAQGKSLGSLLFGKIAEGLASGDKRAVYVRRPGDAQTYVALGSIDLMRQETEWLDRRFIDFDRTRVKEASIKPAKGPAYTVARQKPEDSNFAMMTPLPPGRQLRTETEPNGVGQALFSLSFEDVADATTLDFADATYAAFRTFDGLALSLRLIEKDQAFWVTVTAAADPALTLEKPKDGDKTPIPPAAKAKALNALAAGWAFKLTRYKGVLMTSPLDDLLKPVGAPPPGPGVNAPADPAAPPPAPRPGRRRGR